MSVNPLVFIIIKLCPDMKAKKGNRKEKGYAERQVPGFFGVVFNHLITWQLEKIITHFD
mgnify:CR=1 FL=1